METAVKLAPFIFILIIVFFIFLQSPGVRNEPYARIIWKILTGILMVAVGYRAFITGNSSDWALAALFTFSFIRQLVSRRKANRIA